MLTKILLTALIVIGALAALRAFGRASTTHAERTEEAARRAVHRRMTGEELLPCPRCGAYVSPHETCACVRDTSETRER